MSKPEASKGSPVPRYEGKVSLSELEEINRLRPRFVQDGEEIEVLPQEEFEIATVRIKGNEVQAFKFLAREGDETYYRFAILGTPTADEIIQAIKEANKTKKPVKVRVTLRK